MQPITDPYAVLGVPQDASQEQAREAYRRLAKRYHPDVRADRRSDEEMRRINEAWAILSSPERRARYDAAERRAPAAATGRWSATRRGPRPVGAPSSAWTVVGGSGAGVRSEPRPASVPSAAFLLAVPLVAVLGVAAVLAGILPLLPVVFVLLVVAGAVLDGR